MSEVNSPGLTPPGSPDNLSFEDSLADLEQLVRALEDGSAGLDDALAHYERGIGLIRHCQARLRQAEQRISVLTGIDEGGAPLLQPFAHEATAPEAPPARRGRRRETTCE
jgi:exodeoxyribonuclease VII small subunit